MRTMRGRIGRRLRPLLVVALAVAAAVLATPAPADGIVGGISVAEAGPHVMLSSSPGGVYCSGTAVTADMVLTAAHCAEYAQLREDAGDTLLVLSGDPDLGDGFSGDAYPLDLANSHVHPDWDDQTLEHDIALLAVTDGELQDLAALPAAPVAVEDSLDLFGYGTTGGGTGQGVLRTTTTTVTDTTSSTTSSETAFLSQGAGGSGLCSADSGGAAMRGGVIVGVHSFVLGACGNAQAHSDVYAQLDWIRTTAGLQVVDETAPVVTDLQVSPLVVVVDGSLTVTASVDDGIDGSGVAGAELSVDGGATWIPMTAADLAFDETSEGVTATTTAPPTPDVLDVCVRATDAAGNVAVPVCLPVPVVDPDGGFVSGGGTFDSPAGAVVDDPAVQGRASIGFVSGYRPGATQPHGSTRFVLRAAGLSLTADVFDWLVVRGDDTALLQGTGALGDGHTARFKLWAADATPDTVRLRIWIEDAGGEHDVYDSGTVALTTGSVRVHP